MKPLLYSKWGTKIPFVLALAYLGVSLAAFGQAVKLADAAKPAKEGAAAAVADPIAALTDAAAKAKQGNYEAAISTYKGVLEDGTAGLKARVGMANCLLEMGKYAEAKECLSKAPENAVSNSDWQLAIAKAHFEVGLYSEALEHSQKSFDLDNKQLEARYLTGLIQETTGANKAAIETYKWFNARRENIKDPTAEIYTITGRALDRYSMLIGKPSDYARTILQDLFQAAGEKLDPTDWRPHLAAGELLAAKYNNKEAADEFRAVLKLNKNCVDAYVGLAMFNLSEMKFDDVEKILEAALKINSNSVKAHCGMAALRITQRRFSDATVQLDKALAINPNSLDALSMMAAAHTLMGDTKKPLEFTKRFRSINAESGQLECTIADCLTASRQYPDAERYYLAAIEKTPDLSDARIRLGLLYMQMGHRDKQAREQLEKAFEVDKFHRKAFNTLNLLDEMDQFENKESAHFIVRFDAKRDSVIGVYFNDYLEEIYEEICKDFQYKPAVKTSVEVYPTHDRFAVRTTGLPWIPTVGACTGDVIAMDAPDKGRGVRPYDWARVLRHEFAHTVTLGATGNRMPHWMTEGLAVCAEKKPMQWSWVRMLVFFTRSRKLLPVDQLTTAFWFGKDRQQAYAQSFWACQFIIEKWGFGKIREFIQAFHEKQTEPEAFKSVLGVTQKEFDAQFSEWAMKQVKNWGMRTDLLYTPPEIQKLRQEKPDDVTLLAKLAETQAAFGEGKAAMKTVRQCLEKDPNNALGLEVYAELLTEQIKMLRETQDSGVGARKIEERVKAQREVMMAELKDITKQLFKVDPKNRIAITGMAQLAAEEKRWADAVSYWELLKKICPLDPASAMGLQIAYVNLQMPDKAVAEMLRLDNDNQYDVETRLRIASAYKELGQLPEAAMQTMRAMRIFPYDGKLRQQLAALYLQSEQYDKALRELQVNCDLEPEDSDHFVELAKVFRAAGKSDKAREAAQQALKINPENSRAKEFLNNK